MKPRLSHRNRTLVTSIAFVLAVAISGCSTAYPPERRWDGCGLIGGLVGTGLGAAAGYGVEELNKPHPNTGDLAGGIGGGAVIGGIMGAVVGHEICDPLIPPPPPPPPAPAPVVVMPPPPPAPEVHHEKLVLRGVHFDFNKSNIRPGDAAILDEAAEILKSHPDVNVYDDGYCDAIGSEEYNPQALAAPRRRGGALPRGRGHS